MIESHSEDEAKLAGVCRESDTVMANINSPGQIVISGAAENVKKAIELATAAGASRAIPLQVSDGMVKYLDATTFKVPSIPVIGNVTGAPLTTVEAIKKELRDQLTSPVQWQRSVEYISEQGVDTFYEIGPGRVLTGLIRRTNKEVKTVNIGDLEAVKGLAQSS